MGLPYAPCAPAEVDRHAVGPVESVCGVLLMNLDERVVEDDLFYLVRFAGRVHGCKLCTSPDGSSLGFGYVSFARTDHWPPLDARAIQDRAVRGLNGLTVRDKTLFVGRWDHIPTEDSMELSLAFAVADASETNNPGPDAIGADTAARTLVGLTQVHSLPAYPAAPRYSSIFYEGLAHTD